MKCHKCSKSMQYVKKIKFNKYKIDGWKCLCGEIYYDSEQAQRILLKNKSPQWEFPILSEVSS